MVENFGDKKPVLKDGVFIHNSAVVMGNVRLEQNVNIWCNAVIRAELNYIEIGKNSNVQDNATIHIGINAGVVIGENVSIGHNAVVHGSKIGDNCIIGMGAIVMDNVVVGKNSVIGAGCVIPANNVIPERSVVIGNPFKIVKEVDEIDISNITANARLYVEKSKEF